MKITLTSLIIALSFMVSPYVFSDESSNSVGSWFGVGLGPGYLTETWLANQHEVDSSGLSLKLEGGYDLNRYFGVYGSYDYFDYAGLGDSIHIGSIGVRGREHLTDRISLFVKAGVSHLFDGYNDSGPICSIGAGMEYRLTRVVSIKAGGDYYDELQPVKHRTANLSQVYLGMNYRFGQPPALIVVEEAVEVIKEVKEKLVIQSGTWEVLFLSNSSLLLSTIPLEESLTILKQNPSLSLTVEGYTDSLGATQYNQLLSERRANAVARYFFENGVGVSRITSLGRGGYEPIATNENEQGRSQNRRVELTIQ
ncbi:OmpA family protein [Vibrio crassostreae]|uniref:OmpA family protein n=1 Tax=Vibrio crassostreae TaxID=246167 RepID=UPI0010493BFE|nr:OmpA family protein [Vibrio crassostreae]TCW20773.1 OOP family OmpA-OmpF porin [Vibrio crassostreae]